MLKLFIMRGHPRHWLPVILTYRVIVRVDSTLQMTEQSPDFVDFRNRGQVPLINNRDCVDCITLILIIIHPFLYEDVLIYEKCDNSQRSFRHCPWKCTRCSRSSLS